MEILDWLKSQNTAETQIAHDEIVHLRNYNTHLQTKLASFELVGYCDDNNLLLGDALSTFTVSVKRSEGVDAPLYHLRDK